MYTFRELVFGICLCIIIKSCENKHFSVRSPRNLNAKSCVLPQYSFEKWNIYKKTKIAKHETLLDKFELENDSIIICIDGKETALVEEWSHGLKFVVEIHPSRYSTPNTTVICRNNEKQLENCKNLTQFLCDDFYVDQTLKRNATHVCFNEKWNHKLPEFTAICGQRALQDPTLIEGGKNATAIQHFCDESLPNQRVILTAAHCIADEDDHRLSKELYLEALTMLTFSTISQPMAVDCALTQLQEKLNRGYISGWGYLTVEDKNRSTVLKEITIPNIEDQENSVTNYFKLCPGFISRATSFCKGDSGGGLAFGPNGDYYMISVVKKITTTKFVSHVKFKLLDNKRNSCVLPPHPFSGRWTIVNQPQIQPGMSVPSGTIMLITCDNNHKIDGNKVVFCDKGKWSSDFPTCLKLCPPRISTATMRVTCIYKHEETENCTDAVNGTFATFTCAPFYEHSSLKKNTTQICQNGEWSDQTEPKCEPVCGQKTVEATPLIINGTNVTKGDYPWQVALYQKSNKALICGGSLLSQKVVLTAAHCVTDYAGNNVSEKNYIVAVGKYFRQYDDIRDHKDAQFSELQHIFVAEEYQGGNQNYFGDIALLITVKVFVLSRRVQPVCLDVGSNYNVANQIGYVTGWGTTEENGKQSEVLQELKVPAVSLAVCRRNLLEDDHIYLTHDKLCAGYLNKGISVCKGDSGGGLVFNHDERYWITGIVSISPVSPTTLEGCDSQQYALYTKVSNYINFFILPRLNEFQP